MVGRGKKNDTVAFISLRKIMAIAISKIYIAQYNNVTKYKIRMTCKKQCDIIIMF